MNEFDLMGPQFLSLYTPATFGTIFGAVVLRCILKNTSGQYKDLELSAYDTAYLSGGDQRVVDAAAAKLLVSGNLVAGISPPSIRANKELANAADPIERTVLEAVKSHSISNVSDIYKYVGPISRNIRPKLIEAGLILSDARTAAIRTSCTLLTLTPIVFWGIPKLLIGLSNHKPVALLLVLCAAGLAAAYLFYRPTYIRTMRGDSALDFLKGENRALEYSVKYGSETSGHELALATGLFGTTILLASPMFAQMRSVFRPPVSTSCSSGCGSSCGGGCGGGCGGCGG